MLQLPFSASLATDKQKKDKNDIVINTYINIDLGDIIKGATKSHFYDDQVIIFEINCKKNRSIRITTIKDPGNEYIKFKTEWRAGGNNGFEEAFSGDAIYQCDNKTFYVTMTIKSVEVLSTAPSGKFSFSPEISVEYADM